MSADAEPQVKPINLIDAMKIADAGFASYAAAHPKWFKRIDGTPIPNDLGMHMAQAIVNATGGGGSID